MKYKMMAVRDSAADVFGQPYATLNVGAAARSFGDEINRGGENNTLSSHPEDFDLYELGEYDDSTGLFDTGVPRRVAVGKDLKR